jgi:hypothetical protein
VEDDVVRVEEDERVNEELVVDDLVLEDVAVGVVDELEDVSELD